jgi:hypothetical protein
MGVEGEDNRPVQVNIPGLKAGKLGKLLKKWRKIVIFVRLLMEGLLYKRMLDKLWQKQTESKRNLNS